MPTPSFTNKGATPGLVQKISSGLGFSNKTPVYPTPSGNQISSQIKPITQGSVQGQPLAVNSTHGEAPKPTIQKDVAGNTYQAPKSNPSVLAQQQALNKLGAGLVEDGLTGPKTREAIAKYGTKANTTETLKVEPAKPTTPQVGTTKENAQTVLNTGNQTPLEQSAMSNLTQAGQMTPEEKAANDEVARANALQKSYQNVQTLSPYAEASMYTDRARTPEEIQGLIQAPDLVGRASATQGLLGSLSNIYGSSRVAGANAALQGIQTAASRGLSAAGSNLGAAQNQASRAQNGAGTVFNSSLITPTTQGQAPFSALSGYQEGSDQFGSATDPASGVNVQSYKNYIDQYNQGTVKLNQAKPIEDKITTTLFSNPDLNSQPLSLLTNLNQYLSGQLGSAPQQLLAQQVDNYIKTLGLDTASAVNIATQQKGTLKQLLSNLKDTATKTNEALKTTAESLKKNSSTSSGGTTEDFSWDFLKGLK